MRPPKHWKSALGAFVICAVAFGAWELTASTLRRRVADAERRMASGDYGATTLWFEPPISWDSWMPSPGGGLDIALRVDWDAAFPGGTRGYGIAQFALPVVSRWRGETTNSGDGAEPDVHMAPAADQPDAGVSWLGGEDRLTISALWGGDTGKARPRAVTVRLVVADGAAYGQLAARLYSVSPVALASASVAAPAEAVAGPVAAVFTLPKDENGNRIADAWERQRGTRGGNR
ncbi:hypothetical protein HN371_10780 [Candidatus Poribacteria bacterium]|jgi:hypothetical protein|nr:hypothetical protein [Candidatus Poribacteria bacterium]MBT5534724.1 hypothetical protein [Candidatus Poribacteria bacterium]MBT5711087.1 hypothetical protein [Candidatus Poribacteria bacterium]MBT7095732.1 hypothetical protein [Candidatus Poribacteria bacterium]MBT7807798.1 hypothetical protein [Candidatus Poribacteria bacterium]